MDDQIIKANMALQMIMSEVEKQLADAIRRQDWSDATIKQAYYNGLYTAQMLLVNVFNLPREIKDI